MLFRSSTAISGCLGLKESRWRTAYQSRFGSARWLEPGTTETLIELAQAGVETIDILCPSFAVDCLETLEEIAMENAEEFLTAGGKQLRYIPCLNDCTGHVNFFCDLITSKLELSV